MDVKQQRTGGAPRIAMVLHASPASSRAHRAHFGKFSHLAAGNAALRSPLGAALASAAPAESQSTSLNPTNTRSTHAMASGSLALGAVCSDSSSISVTCNYLTAYFDAGMANPCLDTQIPQVSAVENKSNPVTESMGRFPAKGEPSRLHGNELPAAILADQKQQRGHGQKLDKSQPIHSGSDHCEKAYRPAVTDLHYQQPRHVVAETLSVRDNKSIYFAQPSNGDAS